MLDLVFTNKEGLLGNMKYKSSLGCCDHKMVEFKILMVVRRVHNKSLPWTSGEQTLASSGICLVEVLWNKALMGRGAQQSWLIFKDHLFQAQE